MPPGAVLVPFVFLGVLASAPAHAEDVTQDLGVHFPGADTSAGVDRFWLGSTLRISPDEQVGFLARLHAGELPASARSIAIVKDILLQDPPGPGITYRGKTGSCRDPEAKDPHGWWVGSVEREGRLFLYAALIEGPGASGMACRPMAEKALAALGVLPVR